MAPKNCTGPPPRQDKARGGGGKRIGTVGAGVGGGALPPLGGRGTPEEQVRAVLDRIVNFQPGCVPPSGQAPANQP